jgi:hypothetical protein
MSKQSDAKQDQGYIPKAVPQTCMNCFHFKMDVVPVLNWQDKPTGYERETNKRCGLGGFAVQKMATCNKFKSKS